MRSERPQRRRRGWPLHVMWPRRTEWGGAHAIGTDQGAGGRSPIVALRSYAPAGADAATRVGLVVLVYPFVWRCVSRCAGASTVTQVQSTVQRSCEPLKSSAASDPRARFVRARLTLAAECGLASVLRAFPFVLVMCRVCQIGIPTLSAPNFNKT